MRSAEGEEQALQTTDEHPFFIIGKGWTKAQEPEACHLLQKTDGSTSTVLSSIREEHPEGVAVFNLRVANTHSYFVRAEGSTAQPVWVHNASYGDIDLGGRIRALEGADDTAHAVGRVFAARAKALYIEQVAPWERSGCSVAVSRDIVGGEMCDTYGINGGAPDAAKSGIRAAAERDGALYVEGLGRQHAEVALYEAYSGVESIGVSHWTGPCREVCRPYFGRAGFANLYWNSTYVR